MMPYLIGMGVIFVFIFSLGIWREYHGRTESIAKRFFDNIF